MTQSPPARSGRRNGQRLHPLPVRIMHWINVAAMFIMVTSGWGIYNDDVIIRGFAFPDSLRLGEGAEWSLNWHFAGMWLLVLNGLSYFAYAIYTGRFRERLLPIRVGDIIHTIRETLRFHLAHEDLTTYNAVQKILYIVVLLAGILQVVTGLAIWKPVQFSWLIALVGDFQTARILHFAGMAVIVGFVVVHVALAILVPRTLWAILTGGPKVGPSGHGQPVVES